MAVVCAETRRDVPTALRKGELGAPVLRNRPAGCRLIKRAVRELSAPHALQGDAVLRLRARKQKALRAEFRREGQHVFRGSEISILYAAVHAPPLSHPTPGEVETDI